MVRVYQEAAVTVSISLTMLDCANCGMVFGITKELEKRRRGDGQSFWCPNGHANSWHETDVDRERKRAERLAAELEAAQREVRYARNAEDAALTLAEQRRLEVRATKAEAARIKRRANAGVCQECHRSFADVRRHVSAKHPAAAVEAGVREPDPRPKKKRGA